MSESSLIYGLEFQARSLAPLLAETEKIKFLVGTQSLKQATNQIHLVEFNDENSTLKTTVYSHPKGEIWKLNTSSLDSSKITSCYNHITDEYTCCLKTSIYKLPSNLNPDVIETLEPITEFNTTGYGDVKTTEFHPINENRACSVTDDKVIFWDISDKDAKCISSINLEGKNNPKFTTGKWNPHQNSNQFTAATDTHLKTFDMRTKDIAWAIDGAHSILVRDMDYNMNRQYHLATCGDDGFVKIWDYRQPAQPVFSRSDHTHWVWSIRFNPFHDQLILSASTDGRVLLSSAASVSSENNDISLSDKNLDEIETKQRLSDGPLQWCEHEDSVYCAEWSPAEPWVFASLSHDGRLLISRVKKTLKYQIML